VLWNWPSEHFPLLQKKEKKKEVAIYTKACDFGDEKCYNFSKMFTVYMV